MPDAAEQTAGVDDEMVTASADDAMAETVNGASPKVLFAGTAKAIVCAARPMLNERSTAAAAANAALPAWLARTVQMPTVSGVSVAPVTLQTAAVSDANETASPEELAATRAKAGWSIARSAIAAKVTVCAALP